MSSIFDKWKSNKKQKDEPLPDINNERPAPLPDVSSEEPISNEEQTTENVSSAEIEKELVEELQQEETSETENASDIDNPNDYEERPNVIDNSAEGRQKKMFEVYISGSLLLYMVDGAMPRLIIAGSKMIGYKTDRKASDLAMTNEERKMLEPLADAVSNKWFKQMSEEAQLLIGITAIYARKL